MRNFKYQTSIFLIKTLRFVDQKKWTSSDKKAIKSQKRVRVNLTNMFQNKEINHITTDK